MTPPRAWWALSSSGQVVLVEPEPWLYAPGDWGGVEKGLGTGLPRDYKDIIGNGFACTFGDELVIASPFDPNPNLNLLQVAARSAWTLAYLRYHDREAYGTSIYPESGGLLGWGTDGGGGVYHWATNGGDPDAWPVAVSGRPVFDPPVRLTRLTVSAYIEGLRSGSVPSLALAGWPPADARIEQRQAS